MAIWEAALRAVEPGDAVRRSLRADSIAAARVTVVGAGKAVGAMAEAAEAVLGSQLVGGLVVAPDRHFASLTHIELLHSGHPLPDARSEAAGRKMLERLGGLGSSDRVLGLWSGGGSALIEIPRPPNRLADIQQKTAHALRTGVDIARLNALRTELSALKGGGLARATQASWTNLVISDVAGDDPARVASGPGVIAGGDHRVVACLGDALRAAEAEAWALRYATTVLTDAVAGEARDEGQRLAHAALAVGPSSPPMCLIAGGEPVVHLRGDGIGGRMQEAALAAAMAIADTPLVVACLSTDGTDGRGGAAGAIVDGGTVARAQAAGIDPPARPRPQRQRLRARRHGGPGGVWPDGHQRPRSAVRAVSGAGGRSATPPGRGESAPRDLVYSPRLRDGAP